jgi:hypothetical protein
MNAQMLMRYAGPRYLSGEKEEPTIFQAGDFSLWREARRTEVNARGVTIALKHPARKGRRN